LLSTLWSACHSSPHGITPAGIRQSCQWLSQPSAAWTHNSNQPHSCTQSQQLLLPLRAPHRLRL
jgi:hypothetical protein